MSFSDGRRLAAALLLAVAAGESPAAEPVGHLANVRGNVELNGRPVARAATVSIGDIVETRVGKATLLLGKNQVVHLDVNSRVEITSVLVRPEQGEATELKMPYGRVRAMVRSGGVPRSFRVRSRAAVMGVRGTHIYLDTPQDARLPQTFAAFDGTATIEYTRVPVAGGAVPGPDKKTYTLQKNESMQAGGDAAPGQVAKLPPEAAMALMRQIAPPPAEVRAPEELRRSLEPRRQRPGRKGGGGESLDGSFEPVLQQTPPLANTPAGIPAGYVGFTVNVKGTN
jgi:hypothetical protein